MSENHLHPANKKEIRQVAFTWHEMSSNNGFPLYRVICQLKDSDGLVVEGSHVFILPDMSLPDKHNDIAFTAESAAYNNAVQCLLAATSAYSSI